MSKTTGNEEHVTAAIDSPCVKICVVDRKSRHCIGCKRSLDEIARWGAMSRAERTRIMAELPKRVLAGQGG